MPISAAGRTDPGQRGVSLVELLVVLLVIGMAAGMVVLVMPRGEADIASAVRTAERAVAGARDRAVTEVTVLGVVAGDGRLSVFEAREGRWQRAGIRQMPGGVTVDLLPEEGWRLPEHPGELLLGLAPPRSEEAADGPGIPDEPFAPDIVFSPEGSVTPFALRLHDGRREAVIRVGPFGTIRTDDEDA